MLCPKCINNSPPRIQKTYIKKINQYPSEVALRIKRFARTKKGAPGKLINKFSKKAIEHAEKNFCSKANTRKIENIYKNLLNK